MNERIKQVRLALGLSQDSFGARIGLGKSSLSKIERGANSTTEQTILSICREFGVDEVWLRTGEGEMFSQDRKTVIDRVAAEYKLSESDRAPDSVAAGIAAQQDYAAMLAEEKEAADASSFSVG